MTNESNQMCCKIGLKRIELPSHRKSFTFYGHTARVFNEMHSYKHLHQRHYETFETSTNEYY